MAGLDDAFDLSADPESAAEDPAFEGVNVCRVAALSARLGGRTSALVGLGDELAALGLSARLRGDGVVWADLDPAQIFDQLGSSSAAEGDDRVRAWQAVNESGRQGDAVAFLTAVLGSANERESAAAAAALWQLLSEMDDTWLRRRRWHPFLWERLFDLWELDFPDGPWSWPFPWRATPLETTDAEEGDLDWNAEQWRSIYQRARSRFGDGYSNAALIGFLASWRLARAARSPDPVTRALAFSTAMPEPGPDEADDSPPGGPSVTTPAGALVVSTMIHGTWGWKGDWWRPRSVFHEYILRNHRPNLFSRGARFSWSGAYSDAQRAQAAEDFNDWAYDVAPHGLQTVFAHSYGGEVACRAAIARRHVHEVVLLSTPVTRHVSAAAAGPERRIVDVRLRFDPVLALARRRQRFPSGTPVKLVLLNRWRLDHGATHREDIWRDEDIARRGGL